MVSFIFTLTYMVVLVVTNIIASMCRVLHRVPVSTYNLTFNIKKTIIEEAEGNGSECNKEDYSFSSVPQSMPMGNED